MQGTWVQALVREDPTCCGARAPQLLSLRSRAHKSQLLSPHATTTEACMPGARSPQQEKPLQWEARAPQLEKAHAQQQRPNAAKNKNKNKVNVF